MNDLNSALGTSPLAGWLAVVSLLLSTPGLWGQQPPVARGASLSVGPDVTIIELVGVGQFTGDGGEPCPAGYGPGVCRGLSIGTNACGRGTVPVDWCDQLSGCREEADPYHPVAATSTDHPVIAQNMYRLKDGRFEQIGASFLKHGFASANVGDPDCTWNDEGVENSTCVQPPAGLDQLGLGCTDFYRASLNGFRPLGRRSDVNGASGDHPRTPAGGETDDAYDQRIVVAEQDIDPALNPGARYWMEGQYLVRDDARSGARPAPPPPGSLGGALGPVHPWLGENGLNNASYREATVSGGLSVAMTGPTLRERSALHAWQAVDPSVEIVNADRQTFFPGDPLDPPASGSHPDHWVIERFEAARTVTPTDGLGGTQFHYEYVVHNLNSATSAAGFSVHFGEATTFGTAGFHDIAPHSGEIYDTTDWVLTVDEAIGRISWSAVDAGSTTNALRWGTSFTFWFEADRPPVAMLHEIELLAIDGSLIVPFDDSEPVFADDFELGTTESWDVVIPSVEGVVGRPRTVPR